MLQELGLSETEARVYYAMLEIGPESVQNIAKKATISRTAAYEIIEALHGKGIASTFEKGKKNVFAAEDPNRLEDYFKNRLTSMKDQLSAFKTVVPELRLMQEGDKPRVRYYSGIPGLEALFRDIESLRVDELLEFVDGTQVFETLDEQTVLRLRSSAQYQRIPVRVLFRGEVKNPRPNTNYRMVKTESFKGIIWVYKNRVAFINMRGDIEVVIIESEAFAATQKALFELAWKAGESVRLKAA